MSDDVNDPAKFATLYAPDATVMVAGYSRSAGTATLIAEVVAVARGRERGAA